MGAVERYADEICREIRDRQEEIRATLGLNTLYIGGGTPSVLPLPVLHRIVEALSEVTGVPVGPAAAVCAEGAGGRERGRAAADERKRDQTAADERYEEFTIEVNPEDIVERGPEFVLGLLELGVTRISMGVQSLNDGILRWMNRRHDAARARQAWRIIRGLVPQGVEASQDLRHPRLRGRCPSVMGGAERSEAVGEAFSPCGTSVDLIIGVPGMTDEILSETLKELVSWRPDHISAYQLSIEEGSTLAERIAAGEEKELPEEECRAQYEMVCRALANAGYEHYEISNWALPGRRSIHNSAYWTRLPYVGLGPGAHSLEIRTAAPCLGGYGVHLPESGMDAPCLGGPKEDSLEGRTATPSGPGAHLPEGGMQRRSWNSKALSGWTREGEVLTPEEIREERIMLGLRTADGVEPKLLAKEAKGEGRLPAGLEWNGGRIRISEGDWFIADDIIANLI